MTARYLVLGLGDQLSLNSVAFEGFDAARDCVLMVEERDESEHVPSTKMRGALFRLAMRHFAENLDGRAWPLDYLRIGTHRFHSGAPCCERAAVQLAVGDDLHFMASRSAFAEHAQGKQRLVLAALNLELLDPPEVIAAAFRRARAGVLRALARGADGSRGCGCPTLRSFSRSPSMLKYAIIFALVSLVAGALGFGGVAAGAAGIAKVLFGLFLVLAVVFLVLAALGVGAVKKAID